MTKSKFNLKQLPQLLPSTIDWVQVFKNENPLDVEIGCGRTHFFFDRVRNFPHRNIIGIEWKYEFIQKGQRRIAREQITNGALFHGNAWLLVPLLFGNNSISQVIVNFPDPWWKEKHKKRLVLNEPFLTALKSRMSPDGFILIQTDVKNLFSYYQNLLADNGFIHDQELSEPAIAALVQAKTHREKKCLLQGLPIFRGIFQRPLSAYLSHRKILPFFSG
jgi:tRNA (guanine-N7-)-methyltransferase